MSEKHNPDVVDNYKKTLEVRPNIAYETSNKVWKQITNGEEVIKDEPTIHDIEARLKEEENKRDKEKKFIKRKNHARLFDVEIDGDVKESSDFVAMKKAVIQDNDKLQQEKERYNKLLQDISELI